MNLKFVEDIKGENYHFYHYYITFSTLDVLFILYTFSINTGPEKKKYVLISNVSVELCIVLLLKCFGWSALLSRQSSSSQSKQTDQD